MNTIGGASASFCKMHGMGNEFFVVDLCSLKFSIDKVKLANWLFQQIIGDRNDGVAIVEESCFADAKLTILNPDGSESELCINGTRCAGRYLMEKVDSCVARFVTKTGIREVSLSKKTTRKSIYLMRLNGILAPPDPAFFKSPDLTSTFTKKWTDCPSYQVSLGVPHLIIRGDVREIDLLQEIGQAADLRRDLFPFGVNVSAMHSDNEKAKLQVQTYERGGVGISNCCSSAMLCSAYLSCRLGINIVGQDVLVVSPGGESTCRILSADSVGAGAIEGPVTKVAEGLIQLSVGADTGNDFAIDSLNIRLD